MEEATTLEIMTGNVPRPRVIRNAYYKHEIGSDGRPRCFMSGLPLPLDEQGRLDGITFVNCYFHPCCPSYDELIKLGAKFA